MKHETERDLTGQLHHPLHQLNYLPLFYLLPKEHLDTTKFGDFPRSPHDVLTGPDWVKLYHSDKFAEMLRRGTAGMVWRHFDINAAMRSFSDNYPFRLLAHALSIWAKMAERHGYCTHSLCRMQTLEHPLFPWEEANSIYKGLVKTAYQTWPVADWQKAVRQMPCHEDYAQNRRSTASNDFYRKWYHTRSKTRMEYLGREKEWEELEVPGARPWTRADFQIDYNDFKQTLSETNRKLLEWMICGYTQGEIAAALGYANHSPVCKRLLRIRKKYREYTKATDVPLKKYSPVKDNWNEMTRLLFPKKPAKSLP